MQDRVYEIDAMEKKSRREPMYIHKDKFSADNWADLGSFDDFVHHEQLIYFLATKESQLNYKLKYVSMYGAKFIAVFTYDPNHTPRTYSAEGKYYETYFCYGSCHDGCCCKMLAYNYDTDPISLRQISATI